MNKALAGLPPKSPKGRGLVCGVGINDSGYAVRPRSGGSVVICPYYARWANMLRRAYCPKHLKRSPTYKDVTVCDEWLTFSVFKAWMAGQDWEGKVLDKDLLVQGNKEYGPDTCWFIPQSLNTLLVNCGGGKGSYPLGVSFFAARGKYVAQCRVGGKARYIGLFPTPEEASEAYKQFKSKLIRDIAASSSDKRVKEVFIKYATDLEE